MADYTDIRYGVKNSLQMISKAKGYLTDIPAGRVSYPYAPIQNMNPGYDGCPVIYLWIEGTSYSNGEDGESVHGRLHKVTEFMGVACFSILPENALEEGQTQPSLEELSGNFQLDLERWARQNDRVAGARQLNLLKVGDTLGENATSVLVAFSFSVEYSSAAPY